MSQTPQVIGNFIPNYYVTDALTSLFLRSAPILSPTMMLDFEVVSATSITNLLVGILLFRK